VATDCLVDVDTVRYSVPHRLVRQHVEVLVGIDDVRIFHAGVEVARHRRSTEPHSVVRDPAHYEGLWRARSDERLATPDPQPLEALGRSLSDYARIIEAAGGAS
jgi:hypothetical protein